MSKQRKRVEDKVGKRYWLLITSRGYWAHLQKCGFWCFDGSKKLDKVKARDVGVIYLTSDSGRYESAIGGVIEFTETPVNAEKTNTIFDALYPLRMSMRVVKIFDPPIPFRPFVGQVSFVSNASNFGVSLQGQPIKPIAFDDYRILVGEE